MRLIQRVRPHILHTHTAKAGAVGRVAALLANGARPPIVVHTFHGHVLRGYFDPARTAAFRNLERLLATTTTRLVAVSPEVRDDLVGLGVAAPDKFSVIRLGIDLDAADRGRRRRRQRACGALFGVPGEAFVVGWIGRMTAIKRVPDVLAAFARLRERGVDARLCLVGDGPDRVAVEERAHELGIARSTLFLGYQRDVAPYYALFDALLLPSGERGHARRRDRGARRRHAGGRDARRRRAATSSPTASTGCSCRSAGSTRSPTRSSSLRATRRGAGRWARRAASGSSRATASGG